MRRNGEAEYDRRIAVVLKRGPMKLMTWLGFGGGILAVAIAIERNLSIRQSMIFAIVTFGACALLGIVLFIGAAIITTNTAETRSD